MLMQREKIKPVTDVPITFQLQNLGEECSSQFNGVEWRYNVVYDAKPCTIYLPREGRDAILRARPEAGDVVRLIKTKRGNTYAYIVNRVSEDAESEAPAPRALSTRATASEAPVSNSVTKSPQTPAPAPQPTPSKHLSESSFMAACLVAAIDAKITAEAHARAKGLAGFAFTSDDVRAMAVSIYIHVKGEGRR